jgi:hypothetical protein
MVDKSHKAMRVVTSISPPSVKSFGPGIADAALDVLALTNLTSSRWSSTLTSFTLSWCHKFSPPYTFPITTLEPLYACRGLETFGIRGNVLVELNDCDIDRIAEAWPSLESLSVQPKMSQPPKVTLCALHRLTRSCLRLRILAVSADASATTSRLPHGDQRCRVFRLAWIQYVCGNAKHVAKFIRHTFPTLSLFTVGTWVGGSRENPYGCGPRCWSCSSVISPATSFMLPCCWVNIS